MAKRTCTLKALREAGYTAEQLKDAREIEKNIRLRGKKVLEFIGGKTRRIDPQTGREYTQNIKQLIVADNVLRYQDDKHPDKEYEIDTRTGIDNYGWKHPGLVDIEQNYLYNLRKDGYKIEEWTGSSAETDVKRSNLEKLDDDLWHEPEKMLELFDEIVDPTEDEEHIKYLRGLLEQITDPTKEILNEFKVYLDKNADSNSGEVKIAYDGIGELILNVAGSNTVTQDKSAAEVYVHELVHLAVEHARQHKKGQVVKEVLELNKLYKIASEHITAEMLQDGTDQRAIDKAQRLYEYVFNNKDGEGLAEFIANGLTNKKLREVLGTLDVSKLHKDKIPDGMLAKMEYYFIRMWNAVRNTFKDNPDTIDYKLADLATKLMEHNKHTVKKNGIINSIKRVGGLGILNLNKGLRFTARIVKRGMGASMDMLEYISPEPIAKGVRATKMLAMSIDLTKSDNERKAMMIAASEVSKALDVIGLGGILAPEGTLMYTLNQMHKDTKIRESLESIALTLKGVERHRNRIIQSVGKALTDALPKGTTRKTKIAITEGLLEVGAKVLLSKYDINKIVDIYKDEKELQRLIDDETKIIKDITGEHEVGNYYLSQSMGLGKKLATGISGRTVMGNATDIVLGGDGELLRVKHDLLSNIQEKDRVKVTEAIDRLSTLYGILYTDKSTKSTLNELASKDPSALEAHMLMHAVEEANTITYNTKYGLAMPHKGELKEIKADYITTKVGDDSKETIKKMKKLGYKLKGKTGVDGVYLYVSKVNGLNRFDKHAMSKINRNKRSHNMIGMLNSINGKKKNKEGKLASVSIIEDMVKDMSTDLMKQFDKPTMPDMDGLNAIRDRFGKIVNFEITTDKDIYGDAVEQEKFAPAVLGKSIAEIYEKNVAEKVNSKAEEIMMKDQLNYTKRLKTGKNGVEYIEIGPDAKHVNERAAKYAKTLWESAPRSLRQKVLRNKDGKKYIAIQRELGMDYFGSRMPSLMNLRIPFTKRITVDSGLRKIGLSTVANMMKLSGELWSEMVSYQKVDIVVKTPDVLYGNIISNINMSAALGTNPLTIVNEQIKMYETTKEYTDAEKRIEDIKYQHVVNKTKGIETLESRREGNKEIRRLKGILKDSPVRPLMEAGMFSTVIENLEVEDMKSDGRTAKIFRKFTSRIPQVIKDATGFLFMTEDTKLFKALAAATQYSDFIARAVRYHILLDEGMSPNRALKIVLDEFNNYNRPEPTMLKWLSSTGASFFHKYPIGANKMLAEKAQSNPAALMGLILTDVTSPMDANLVEKDMLYNTHSPLDLLFNQNKLHTLPPSTLELLGLI